MNPDSDFDYEHARKAFMRFTGAFILVCLLGLAASQLVGCSLFQPQSEVASLCTQIADKNAGVTCVKAGYAVVRDAAELTERRFNQGRIKPGAAQDIAARLENLNDAIELVEIAVFAGAYGEASDRMNAVIDLLDLLEGELR